MAARGRDIVARLIAALEPDDVVLGGGNIKRLKDLPSRCRAGDNANAFLGGLRLWESGRGAACVGGQREMWRQSSHGLIGTQLKT